MVIEGVFEFVGGVEGVVFHHGRPEFQYGVEGCQVLRAVGQQDGHAIPGANPQRAESGGGVADVLVKLAVGLGAPEEVDGRLVAVDGQVVVVEVEQRGVTVFDGGWGPLGVVLQPGFGFKSRGFSSRH